MNKKNNTNSLSYLSLLAFVTHQHMYLDIKVPFGQCTLLLQWSSYPYNQDHCETFHKSHHSITSYCSCDLSYTLFQYYSTTQTIDVN